MKTDERGFVVVDERQASSNPRIFAAGDVTGGPQYVYVAAATGRAAALNATAAAGARPAVVDYTGMPGVVFTRPQLGSAGLTEAQAPVRRSGRTRPRTCRVACCRPPAGRSRHRNPRHAAVIPLWGFPLRANQVPEANPAGGIRSCGCGFQTA